ncbi:MAG: PSD1 and planctomycete cytochrome C domain-containing protein [Verrucomicrobiota bacterium]
MKPRIQGSGFLLGILFSIGLSATNSKAGEIPEPHLQFFEEKIRPLLSESCLECHSTKTKQKGGLTLDSREGWMTGGDNGPAIVPGNAEKSLLIKAVGYLDSGFQMPPKKKLRPNQIADLRKWVGIGAPDPRTGPAATKREIFDIEKLKAVHWAWKTPAGKVPLPTIDDQTWPTTAIDYFVRHQQEKQQIEPNPRAEKRILARRLYFDLTGLPPEPAELEAFLQNDAGAAYDDLVDSLLDSPHFGERWGQHWLDIMRFAETRGHEQDYPIPEAYRYRDYVIRAFNQDVPYNQLVMEHIAGDLLDQPRIDPATRTNQSIQGTGFWHLGEATHSPVNIREDETIRVANQIDVFSKAFLALTVSCARCHDHKFDAISTKDYYALFGYLQSSSYQLADVSDPEAQAKATDDLEAFHGTHGPAIARAKALELIDGLKSFPAYVEASLHFLATEKTRADKKSKALQWDPKAMEIHTAESGLSRDRLEAWVRVMDQAGKEPTHLFHHLTQFEPGRSSLPAWHQMQKTNFEKKRTEEVVLTTAEEGERNYVKSERPYDPARDSIIDFAKDPPLWLTSGHRFGSGPAGTGTLLLGGPAKQSLIGVVEDPAAHADVLTDRLSGFYRTPTFEVTSDRIWIRCRGKASLFLAVDSHRVCQGPLHSARLKKNLNPDGGYQWVAHDVQKYLGHRVHLEFTPSGPFSVSHIRFGRDKPAELPVLNQSIVDAVKGTRIPDVGTLANRFSEGLIPGLSQLMEGKITTIEDARIVNFLLRHENLFIGSKDPSPAQKSLIDKKKAIEARIPKPVPALALLDGSPENEPVHIRGNHRTLSKDPVPRAFLTALQGGEKEAPDTGSGRLQLAQQLIDPDNPLTARVFVNRVWHHLFGRGIVESVDNFGATGQKPSHPALLDFLARDFMAHGWSMKHVIRQVVRSSTYRLSSQPNPAMARIDPSNQWLYHMPVRRLTGEAVRDSLLAVSGRLDRKPFGPSTMVYISPFTRNNRSPGGNGPVDGDGRRSIYIEGRRNHLDSFLTAFDKPTPFTAIGKRNVSNSPAQPLIMLNNPLVHQQARLWAKRLLQSASDDGARIDQAYLTAYSRRPEPWEKEAALAFLDQQARQYSGETKQEHAWTDLGHTLLNVKEFIFIN